MNVWSCQPAFMSLLDGGTHNSTAYARTVENVVYFACILKKMLEERRALFEADLNYWSRRNCAGQLPLHADTEGLRNLSSQVVAFS